MERKQKKNELHKNEENNNKIQPQNNEENIESGNLDIISKEIDEKSNNDSIVTPKPPEKERSPKYILRNAIIAVLVGFVTMFILYQFMSDEETINKILKMPFWLPLAGMGAFLLVYVLNALRSHIVLRTLKEKVKFKYLIRNSILGLFFNNLTPFAMGGQPYKIYDLTKHGVKTAHASNTVLSRFLSQNLITTIISVIGYFIFSDIFLQMGWSGSIFLLGFTVSMVVNILLFAFTVSNRIKRFFFKILHLKVIKKLVGITHYSTEQIQEKINKRVSEFRVSFNTLWKKNFLVMLAEAMLGILTLALHSGILYVFIRFFSNGFDPDITVQYPKLIQVILIHYAMGFVVYYSPTPGASGAVELMYFPVLAVFSDNNSAVGAGIVAWRLGTFYLPIVLGFVTYVFRNKTFFKKLKKSSRTEDSEVEQKPQNNNSQ